MQRTDPVLSLAMANISKIDKVDCDRLSSLWTVFTKCAGNLENGHRLENLSWRLWYRECQLLERERHTEAEQSHDSTFELQLEKDRPQSTSKLPPLSTSVDSANSEDMDAKMHADLSCHKSAGRHLTPDRFHELVTQFGQETLEYRAWSATNEAQEPKGGLETVIEHGSCHRSDLNAQACRERNDESQQALEAAKNDATLASNKSNSVHLSTSLKFSTSSGLRRASSVVHGFNPTCVSVKQNMHDAGHFYPGLTTKTNDNKSMFFIDSSPSESDHENDMLSNTQGQSSNVKGEVQLPLSVEVASPEPRPTKRHTSFKEIVDEGSEYESSPFDTDDESDSDLDDDKQHGESAIMTDEEDDGDHDTANKETQGEDDDDWDSVCSESRASSPQNSTMFDKMGTDVHRPGLVSRKSILSTLLTNPMTRLSNTQSRSSPAISQSQRSSPKQTPHQSHIMTNSGSSVLANIRTSPTVIKGSVSPRTTRRNMLATELSESLRRHLLWERKQKSVSSGTQASQTVLKRRHTAYDLTKVQDFPLTSSSFDAKQKHEITSDNEFGYNGAGW